MHTTKSVKSYTRIQGLRMELALIKAMKREGKIRAEGCAQKSWIMKRKPATDLSSATSGEAVNRRRTDVLAYMRANPMKEMSWRPVANNVDVGTSQPESIGRDMAYLTERGLLERRRAENHAWMYWFDPSKNLPLPPKGQAS